MLLSACSAEIVQVETMSVELEAKKITVATAQKDCEELLVEIVSERRVADEQKKQASSRKRKNQQWFNSRG